IGSMELFEKSQKTIDLMLNRWNFAQSGSGRVPFWSPQNTAQGENSPHLELNTGVTYTLLKGKTAEETLSYVTLPEVKGEDLQKLMDFISQCVMSEAGVSSANDSAAAGLDTTKTATGIRNIQSTNNIMGSVYWGNLRPSLRAIVRRNITVEFANADPLDVLRLFGGDHQKMQTLLSEDAESITIDVNILMSKARNQELLQNCLTSVNSFQQYYQSPVPVQHRGEQLYQNIMRALQQPNPEELIDPLDEAFGPQ